MKFLPCLLFVGSAALLAGCTAATPALSPAERYAQINRNVIYQNETGNDDLDHMLMFRPSNQLTVWNVYHRD
jgi:hypothetical protein